MRSVWEVVKIVEGIDIILKVDCVLGYGFSAVKRKAPSVQRNFLFSRTHFIHMRYVPNNFCAVWRCEICQYTHALFFV